MMKGILISAILGTLVSFNVFSQSAKIVDAVTNVPISDVTIYSERTGLGTISNEIGELDWKGEPMDSLTLTHVSYEKQKLVIHQDGQVIKLKPHVTILPAMVVSDFASTVMTRAFERATKNSSDKNYQKAFYRQITTNNDVATEVHEIFYTIESNNSGVIRNRIDEARYAVKKKKDSTALVVHYTNASAMALGSHVYSELPAEKKEVLLPLMPSADSLYFFSASGSYREGGENLVRIYCEPRDNIAKPMVSGEVVINESTLVVRHASFFLRNSLGMDSVGKGKRKWPTSNHFHEITFDFQNDGRLNYVRYNASFEVTASGSKQKINVSSFLFVFDQLNKAKRLHESDLKSNDLNMIRKKKYKPQFWKDNPIVKRTPLQEETINQFEKEGAFGTMFKK